MCDKFDKLDKHLEEMHKSIANIKHQYETAELDTEELDVFADFEDLFTPDVSRGERMTEEEKQSIEPDDLKPKKPSNRAPEGIRTFTVCRQSDESGISGEGVVIEGVTFATGHTVIHWLTPRSPRLYRFL